VQAVRDELTSKFERATRVADNFKTKELNRSLQTQKDEMNAEFNQKAQLEWDTHLKDFKSTKVNLCEEIEHIKREHAKEISHLQINLGETKRFIEQ
jgi:hypothetical protein